jgi:mannose-6-phosphate isomerase-like protein (cupin superfamily)
MEELSCLIIKKESLKNDQALKLGSRGARKILVTSIYESKETECKSNIWTPPADDQEKCPVQITDNYEVAFFNQYALQDRHYHKIGTEIYMVLEGNMIIEVKGKAYELTKGDMIIINPNSFHEVKRTTEFLCRVITVNCCGPKDKYLNK